MRSIDHRIAGYASSGDPARTAPVFDPATGDHQADVALAGQVEVDAAVQAAAKAFGEWRDASLTKRARVMFALRELLVRHEDELARLVTAEHGKTVEDARGEVLRGREVVEFACGIPNLLAGRYSDQVSSGIDTFTFRQPLGVCAGITPFNFPVMVPLWMHPVAIACGNAFVLKPSERDPSASNLIAELYADAGLPDGVLNVVHGDKTAVDALCTHPDVAAVSFVGSTPVARHVHRTASEAGKRVQALGGAKNHAVVLPDADLDLAADQIAAAAYGSAGQRCMAVSAVVAVGDIADSLVARLAARARGVRVGPGSDPASEMGPVITAASRDRVVDYLEQGERAGATRVVDGRGLELGDGYFVGPSLLDRVEPGMSVYADEIFGPVLVVLRAPTESAAIDLINANPYGNGTALFTGDGAAARRFTREVTVGMVGVNVPIPVPAAFHSFGGWKASLFGDTHVYGPEGVNFYTRAKVVTSRWPRPESGLALNFPASH
jgi:malonate-semialdehyde dehydrogenase (acetylating)/methylmalonate-semialdehyde dehydrogenase